MISIDNLKNEFKNFANNYDMTELAIVRKFYHSYRVMDICMLLAKYNNFSDENTEIAMLVGLLHDYSRFEQWTRFKTYSDIRSIDHGDLAVKRLFDDNEIINYCTNKEYYDEIYDAIKYHNKHSFPNSLSEHNKLLCKIIRDADKLDIFYLLGINEDLMVEDDNIISPAIKDYFYNHSSIRHEDANNASDDVILKLAMVYDLNFDYSFKHMYDMKLIDRMFKNIKNKEKFKPYFDYINNFIKEKLNK